MYRRDNANEILSSVCPCYGIEFRLADTRIHCYVRKDMEDFEEPVIEIIELMAEDVIVTSCPLQFDDPPSLPSLGD